MAGKTKKSQDRYLDAVEKALGEFKAQYPEAVPESYRQNSASIRIRIISPAFFRKSKSYRHELVQGFLKNRLSEDEFQEISMLLLLAPGEESDSLLNLEFNDPQESRL